MTPGTLLIRADAGVTIGTGHVMRCLALAQAWQDAGGSVTFAMAQSTSAINERLHNEGFRVVEIEGSPASRIDLERTTDQAQAARASWVVVDGYDFDPPYQMALGEAGFKVLLVDDNGQLEGYTADVVLNQNLHADEKMYRERAPRTKLVLGTKFALLRREFGSWSSRREISVVAGKVLVVMGGSDPDNITSRVIQAMDQVALPGLELSVVVGGSNPHLPSIAAAAARAQHPSRILANVTEVHKLIAGADLAISAAGSICWEYCALGLPAVVVAVAENQALAADALDRAGAVRLVRGGGGFDVMEMTQLVTRLVNSRDERQFMAQVGPTLVDGRGASRVVSILLSERCAN